MEPSHTLAKGSVVSGFENANERLSEPCQVSPSDKPASGYTGMLKHVSSENRAHQKDYFLLPVNYRAAHMPGYTGKRDIR
jgi:hypothetical protein